MFCPSWKWHITGSLWSPVRTLQVAPLWCDLGFFPNSRGNKAAQNLCPITSPPPLPPFRKTISLLQICWASESPAYSSAHTRTIHHKHACILARSLPALLVRACTSAAHATCYATHEVGGSACMREHSAFCSLRLSR